MLRAAIAFLMCVLLSSAALAQKRVALVVGIDKYDNLGSREQLERAVKDANSVASALTSLGYDVTKAENVGRAAFNAHWQGFLDKLRPGDTAAIYFSGHGVEIEGLNFLLPRDAPNVSYGRQEQVKRESLSVSELLLDLRPRKPQVTLLILDACRDHPLIPPEYRSANQRSGLARMDAPAGTFIMYSAGAGETALDRLPGNDPDKTNSVYTRRLLPLLKKPGLALPELARQVRAEVSDLAATVPHTQRPAYYDGVVGKFCLAGCEGATATVPEVTEAAREWARVDKTSAAELETFVRRHGSSPEADYARARIDSLKQQVAVAAPPKAAGPTPPKPAQPAAAVMPAPPSARCDGVETLVGNERLCLKPKDTFKDCAECPEMVVVPAGSFMMGSPASEAERNSDEGPQRKVTIGKPFAAGKFEVTFAEWEACVAAGGSAGGCRHKPQDQGWGRGKRPVINVSWDDAKEYVVWLSKRTGMSYRLLTEAEWEYTARAGTTTPFSTGHMVTAEQANFDGGTYGGSAKGVYRQKTVEVGSFKPNAFGLHDVHGNVWEWVEDCWIQGYHGAPSDGTAWATGDCTWPGRVLRGGSWYADPRFLRSASRFRSTPSSRGSLLGFRVARTLD